MLEPESLLFAVSLRDDAAGAEVGDGGGDGFGGLRLVDLEDAHGVGRQASGAIAGLPPPTARVIARYAC